MGESEGGGGEDIAEEQTLSGEAFRVGKTREGVLKKRGVNGREKNGVKYEAGVYDRVGNTTTYHFL